MRHARARRTRARRRQYHYTRKCGKTQRSRGRELERKVRQALEMLKIGGCIATYFVSEPNDERDKAGIDAGFTAVDGVEVLFQVKSSDRGVAKHMQKHPDIPCVNFHGCTSTLDVLACLQRQFGLPELPPLDELSYR